MADPPDGELVEFSRQPFTAKPVRTVRLGADTGQAGAPLHVRLYDLQIRAGADLPVEPM